MFFQKQIANQLVGWALGVVAKLDLNKDKVPDKEQVLPLVEKLISAGSKLFGAVNFVAVGEAFTLIAEGAQKLVGAVDQAKLKEHGPEVKTAAVDLFNFVKSCIPEKPVELAAAVESAVDQAEA